MANKSPKLANLKPFKKGYSGNPKGRPPDMLTNSMKKLTKIELEDIANLIIKGSVEEIKKVTRDPTAPAIQVMIASVVMEIIYNGDMNSLDKFLNRLIGKAVDTVDDVGNGCLPPQVIVQLPAKRCTTSDE